MRVLASIVLSLAATLSSTHLVRAETTRPAPQLEAIRSLIGNWAGKGSMMTEGKTLPVSVTWNCVESTGSAGVKCKFVMTGLPGFTYQFDDLWGFSPQDGLTHWYTVTNAGEVHDHRGHFGPEGGQLETEIPVGGKMFSEVVRIKRKGKSLVISWTVTLGGTLKDKGDVTLSPRTR